MRSAHPYLLDLITPTVLGESTNYEVPHSRPSWAQIFASGPYFKLSGMP